MLHRTKLGLVTVRCRRVDRLSQSNAQLWSNSDSTIYDFDIASEFSKSIYCVLFDGFLRMVSIGEATTLDTWATISPATLSLAMTVPLPWATISPFVGDGPMGFHGKDSVATTRHITTTIQIYDIFLMSIERQRLEKNTGVYSVNRVFFYRLN